MEKTKKDRVWQEIKSWIIVILIALGLKTTIVASYIVPTGSMEKTIMIGDFLLGNQFIYGSRTPDWIGIPWTRVGFKIPWFRLPGFKKPSQGDIVIFRYPDDQRVSYVKRCVAGPGQTLEIRTRKLFVDGVELELPPNGQFIRNFTHPSYWKDPTIFPKGIGNPDNYGPVYVPAKGDTLWANQVNRQLLESIIRLNGRDVDFINGRLWIDRRQTDYYVVEQDHYFMMGDNRDNSLDSRFWGFVPFDLILGRAMVVFFSWNSDVPLYRIDSKIRWNRFGRILS